MNHRSLNFLTFNVRSLISKSRQIDLANTLKCNNIDIAFIQECHLKSIRSVKINGYNLIYDHSPIGVAILIKNSLQYSKFFLKDIGINTSFIQITSKQNNNTQRKFLLGSVYVQCIYSPQQLEADLNTILRSCQSFDGFILGGDFNAKCTSWGDIQDNVNGKALKKWLDANILDVLRICDSHPSYPNGPSYLDHFLISAHLINKDDPNYSVSSLPSFSDHFPLKLKIKMEFLNIILKPPRTFTSYRNTNWHNFRSDLGTASEQIMPPSNVNLSNDCIDAHTKGLSNVLSSIHGSHSQQHTIRDDKAPLSERSQNLYKIKYQWQKEMKAIFHRTGNRHSSEYKILSTQVELLKKIIDESIEKEEALKFGSDLQIIKPGPNAFMKINQITGKRKSPFCHRIKHNNVILTNPSEISNQFKEFYSQVFRQTIPEQPVEDLESAIPSCIGSVPGHIYSFDDSFTAIANPDTYHFIDSGKVKEIIQRINAKKSSGIDGISNFIIKKIPDATVQLLTCLFNHCINNCYFPNDWKLANIIPIKKKKDSEAVADFRPISLLSNLGKLFEHILKEKIENEFTIDPISNLQFGFKKSHSTQHALLKFHSDITRNLNNQVCTVAISLDIEKAFDSVCHNGIIYKLIGLGIDPFLIKIIQSFLTDRKFTVQIQSTSSSWGNVNSGVPQGSVLAPYLFNLFLNDFPHTTQNSQAILYADDCLIYAHSTSPVQALSYAAAHLEIINDFYKTWGIKINAAKSEAICIRNASRKCPRSVVPESKSLCTVLDGIEIPFKTSIKYLGINFNKLLKFNPHARSMLQKANQITGMFSRLFNSKHLPEKTKLLLYKVAIRPVLMYGFPIWFTISPIVAKELEIFERKILRKCIDKHYVSRTKKYSNTYIYDMSGVQPFCKYALHHHKLFIERLATHGNSLLEDTYDLDKDLQWSGAAYISPVGIINENTDNVPDQQLLPRFYEKSTPGSHRG